MFIPRYFTQFLCGMRFSSFAFSFRRNFLTCSLSAGPIYKQGKRFGDDSKTCKKIRCFHAGKEFSFSRNWSGPRITSLQYASPIENSMERFIENEPIQYSRCPFFSPRNELLNETPFDQFLVWTALLWWPRFSSSRKNTAYGAKSLGNRNRLTTNIQHVEKASPDNAWFVTCKKISNLNFSLFVFFICI